MTEPEKMKVAELRAALQERGLDTKGTKPILVSRLQEAIREEEEKKEPTPEPEPEPEPEKVEEETPTESTEEVVEEEVKAEESMDVEESAKVEAVETAETKKEDDKPPSAAPQGVKRKMDDEPFEVKENEPEIPDNLLCLDWHNSDLNLRILDTLSEGVPFSRDGWAYCYAAARATFGFTSGRIWYEVKYVDNMDVKIDKETTTYDLRVGWSTNNSSLMLGEDALSWCYSSCEGKMANNKKFEDYGEKFQKGDVIGAFLDFTQGEINVTFTKNGEDQGDAFQIAKDTLGETALFPHVMTRNVKFEVNFGIDKVEATKENWMEALSPEYVKVGNVGEGDRVRGNPRVSSREQCEMIMMIGLPGCGKTTWVNKYVADNPDKQYNVVSTTTMINKMTVNGEPRKTLHKGKWEQVVQKATRSLQEMIRAASQRRRNVIIDQTNVYPAAQKRKARPFEGFQRRAVVVLPTDEIYKERVAAQKAAKEMDIPDEAIMEMKANYGLPEDETDAVVPMFKEVTFTELNREEASKVVELYNKVAKEKGYGKKHEDRKLKKFKTGNQRPGNFKGNHNNRGRNINRPIHGMRGGRGGPGGPGGPRGPRGHPMRGGPWMRGRGGPMGPGPMVRGGMMNRAGPMGPSPWQGNNMGAPMRNNMGGGGGSPGNWGPWNHGSGMGPMGNMNNMGPRQGMGGGLFTGNQASNFGNNQGYGNSGGGGNGGYNDNGFTGGAGGGGGGGGGYGQRRNFDGMGGGGMGNFPNNQGGNFSNNPTGTWSNSSNMMGMQSPANNFPNDFGNNYGNNYGNKFSGQQNGGMRQMQGKKFGGGGGGGGGGGNFRGNMNRGMGRGGGNRGGNRGRRF